MPDLPRSEVAEPGSEHVRSRQDEKPLPKRRKCYFALDRFLQSCCLGAWTLVFHKLNTNNTFTM